MQRARRRTASGIVIVLVAGLSSGAFLSRFLAENLYRQLTIFYYWMPSALLIGVVTLIMVAPAFVLKRRQADPNALLRYALSLLPFLLLALYLFQRQTHTVEATVLLAGSAALVASLRLAKYLPGKWAHSALAATVFLLPLALYLMTLAPTVGEHDTFEFQVLSYELGIAHPTGYPLYILVGKLFTLLPFGNVAYRVNLSSALFATGAVLVLYHTIYYLSRHRIASALAALTFAFSYSFWSQAVAAEVYALNALFVALTCYLLLRCFQPTSIAPPGSQGRVGSGMPLVRRAASYVRNSRSVLAYATSFTYGLSLTHHRTMLLLAPAIITYALLKKPRFVVRLRRLVLLLIAFATPVLALYAYLPLRWWQMHGGMMGWTEFSNLVLGTQFSAALRWGSWFQDPSRLRMYLRVLLEQYPVPALGLALLGLVSLLWPRRPLALLPGWKEGVLLASAFLAYVLFGLSYYVPDVSLFLIPSHLIVAIALGLGVAWLCQLVERLLARLASLAQPARRTMLRSAALTLLGLLPMSLVWTNIADVDRSGEYGLYNWGRYVLQRELPPGAVILADSVHMAPLHYLQKVEGVRADTETGVFPDEASNRAQLERRLAQDRPVFLARFLPGLAQAYHLRSLGPLVEVSPYPLTELPADLSTLHTTFGDKILLLGYRLDSASLTATDPVRFTLYWKALEPVAANYDVRLRLVGPHGHIWHQTRGRPPVNGLYPTGAWQPGEIIPDFHELDSDGNLPSGEYELQLGLFAPFAKRGLTPGDTEEDYLSIAKLFISSAVHWSPQMQYGLRTNFNDQIMLLGYDLPETVTPGATVPLTLYWQRIGPVSCDYEVALELAPPGGGAVWRSVEPALFGRYGTSHWVEGQAVVDTRQLTVPATSSSQLELRVDLRDPETDRQLPAVSSWPPIRQDDPVIARVRLRDLPVAPSDSENLPANFENKVLLLDIELHNVQVKRGDALQLTLTWQGLTSIDEDYTVFVHLLDENERIWGQEDIQPVYGTRPTSQWREGEIILDRHTVWTDAGSPLGLYDIEAGLYLLRTMERLQVLDASGDAIANRVLLGPVEIVP